jgi:hypothetical protein
MKKSLPKPENWQDFETLCKKLFGEVWLCKNTIKKNGRNGQNQAGVDVYAKPKGENGFFGIQCKGKDDYLQVKLTKKEILAEIAKAKKFEPPLKVFIIATTANKDVAIEAFIRTEDLKSTQNGGFEILLYDWPDLADLIEDHRETYQWYIDEQKFRQQFECSISFNGEPTLTINPVYLRKVTRYITKEQDEAFLDTGLGRLMNSYHQRTNWISPYLPKPKQQCNYTNCSVKIRITNTGSKVLEDWKFKITLNPLQVRSVKKHYTGEPTELTRLLPNAAISVMQIRMQSLFVYEEDLEVFYKPVENDRLFKKIAATLAFGCNPLITCKRKLPCNGSFWQGIIALRAD